MQASVEEAPIPLTRREKWAWIFIDIANSVYSTVGVSGFLPLLLQSAALDYTGFPYVCGNVVRDPTAVSFVFGNATDATAMYYVVGRVLNGDQCQQLAGAGPTCVGEYCLGFPPTMADCLLSDGATPQPLSLPGGSDPTSYASFAISASVAAQVALFLLVGAAADVGAMRKHMLTSGALIGGFLSIACAGVNGRTWWAGAPLLVATNMAFGLTTVCSNAYLPVLTRASPAILTAMAVVKSIPATSILESGTQIRSPSVETSTPVGVVGENISASATREVVCVTDADVAVMAAKESDALSNAGFAAGYVAGLVAIGLCLPSALSLEPIAAYQIAMVITGVWWLVFSVVPMLYLLPRPGPPAPPGGAAALVRASVRSTVRTVRTIRTKLPATGAMLIWWMIGSDAVFLIGSIGGLFANSEVDWGCTPGAKGTGILTMFAIAPVAAAAGNIIYPFIARRLNWGVATPLLATLAATAVIPMYGLIGLATGGSFGALKTGRELIMMATWYGFQIGAYQAYSRASFASLIPHGEEAALFSIYEVRVAVLHEPVSMRASIATTITVFLMYHPQLTNRGSSAIGPLVLAAVQIATGDVRWGFVFVLFSISIAFFGIMRIDVVAGAARAATVESTLIPLGMNISATPDVSLVDSDDGRDGRSSAQRINLERDSDISIVATTGASAAFAPNTAERRQLGDSAVRSLL